MIARGPGRCWLLLLAVGPLGLSACNESNAGGAPGVLLMFGETGMGPREFSYPRAAVRGAHDRLYVVDKAARVQCYAPSGEFVLEWRMPAWDAGKPTGLGVGPDGRVYAADTHYARVVVYSPEGTLLGRFGTHGTGPGQFIMPTDVAVTRDGTIYVSEYGGNDRISRFSAAYEHELSFGGPDAGDARLQRPQALLLDDDGSLWVADACNHRICHFTANGVFLGSFGHSGTALGELRFPYGLDRLADGTFVVCEYGNNRVQRFTREGRSLGAWGRAGRGPGQLAYPWAAVAGPDDRLYILDSGNNRVQVIDGRQATVWQAHGTPPP